MALFTLCAFRKEQAFPNSFLREYGQETNRYIDPQILSVDI